MSKYANNGHFSLNKLSLFWKDQTEDEKELDLSVAYVQLDLFESIFDGAMSGSVSIMDTYNLQDILPIYGNERIEIEFHTQGNENNPVEFEGRVYKVSEKHRISDHATGYTIHFISDIALKSQATNVNRGYEGTASEIVDSIFSEFLQPPEKRLESVSTLGVGTYTFGEVKPLEAISLLSKRAYSTTDEVGYVFYEDSKQFNFVPLQHLYKQEPTRSYRSRPAGFYDDESQATQESHGTLQDFRIKEENSYLDRMAEGQHGASFKKFDLFSKTYSTYTHDKESAYDPNKSLGEIAYKKELEKSPYNKVSIRYTNDSEFDLERMCRGITSKIDLNTIRVEIVVFGDSYIRAGQVLDVTLPQLNTDQENVNDLISGKFLITQCHHQLIMSDAYLQTMMIQKEAYEQR